MGKFKIMGMSDSVLMPTGYANQSRELFKRLAREPDFDCYFFGWHYFGRPMYVNFGKNLLTEADYGNSFLMLPADGANFGEGMLVSHLNEYKPDLIWILGDLFFFDYMHRRQFDFSPVKTVMYFPSDGYPLVLDAARVLNKVSYRVAMSKYGQGQAIDLGFKDTKYIPHATDHKIFYPIEDKARLRDEWSKKFNYNLSDKFIVGTVNRMQGRKMFGELFKAFALFAKDKHDVVLLVNADPNDPSRAIEPFRLAHALGISQKIIWTGMRFFNGLSEPELREVYNLFDCQINATSGEGFGITAIEAMACEVPTIITDFTTTKEIITDNKAGLAVKVAYEVTGTYNVERAMVDTKDFAEKLQYYYDNREEMRKHGWNGREAVLREYAWDTGLEGGIYAKWKKLFDEVLET